MLQNDFQRVADAAELTSIAPDPVEKASARGRIPCGRRDRGLMKAELRALPGMAVMGLIACQE